MELTSDPISEQQRAIRLLTAVARSEGLQTPQFCDLSRKYAPPESSEERLRRKMEAAKQRRNEAIARAAAAATASLPVTMTRSGPMQMYITPVTDSSTSHIENRPVQGNQITFESSSNHLIPFSTSKQINTRRGTWKEMNKIQSSLISTDEESLTKPLQPVKLTDSVLFPIQSQNQFTSTTKMRTNDPITTTYGMNTMSKYLSTVVSPPVNELAKTESGREQLVATSNIVTGPAGFRPIFFHPLPLSEHRATHELALKRVLSARPERQGRAAVSIGNAWVLEECFMRNGYLILGDDRNSVSGVAHSFSTPPLLHLAVQMDSEDCILVLLNIGVDVTAKNAAGYTAKHMAIVTGKQHLADLIIEPPQEKVKLVSSMFL